MATDVSLKLSLPVAASAQAAPDTDRAKEPDGGAFGRVLETCQQSPDPTEEPRTDGLNTARGSATDAPPDVPGKDAAAAKATEKDKDDEEALSGWIANAVGLVAAALPMPAALPQVVALSKKLGMGPSKPALASVTASTVMANHAADTLPGSVAATALASTGPALTDAALLATDTASSVQSESDFVSRQGFGANQALATRGRVPTESSDRQAAITTADMRWMPRPVVSVAVADQAVEPSVATAVTAEATGLAQSFGGHGPGAGKVGHANHLAAGFAARADASTLSGASQLQWRVAALPQSEEPRLAEARNEMPTASIPSTVSLAGGSTGAVSSFKERRQEDDFETTDGAASVQGGANAAPSLSGVNATQGADQGVAWSPYRFAEQVVAGLPTQLNQADFQVAGADGEGTVQVSITLNGNVTEIAFQTENLETRQMLEQSRPHLEQLLAQQGLLLSGVMVGQGGGDSQRQPQAPSTASMHSAGGMRAVSAAAINAPVRVTNPLAMLDVFA